MRRRTCSACSSPRSNRSPPSCSRACRTAIDGTGYELVVYVGGNHRSDPGWERQYVSRLSGTLADGMIIVTPTTSDFPSSAPIVAVDPHTGRSSTPTIVSDNLAGAVAATEHLIGLGHRRIGFLPRTPGARVGTPARVGLPPGDGVRRSRRRRIAHARRWVPRRCGRGFHPRACLDRTDRPTAVFAANDLSAIETIRVACALGLDVPGDVSVIGFDNIPESALAVAAAHHRRPVDPTDGILRRRRARRPDRSIVDADPRDAADSTRRSAVDRTAELTLARTRAGADRCRRSARCEISCCTGRSALASRPVAVEWL